MAAAPVTGALGATGALLVRPVEVLGGLKRRNGVTRGVAAGADGRRPGDWSLLARQCLTNVSMRVRVHAIKQ